MLPSKPENPVNNPGSYNYQYALRVLSFLIYLEQKKFPKTKSELMSAVEKHHSNNEYLSIRKKLWDRVEGLVQDHHLMEIAELTTEQWNVIHKRSFLDKFGSLHSFSKFISSDYLGAFLKNFAHSKFGGVVESVFDPAFGIGNIIFNAFDGSEQTSVVEVDEYGITTEVNGIIAKNIHGYELNSVVCDIANNAGKLFGFNTSVETMDALLTASKSEKKHQLVVCEPPVGVRLQKIHSQQDWAFGIPERQSEWAWAQIVHKNIAPSGYGLLFVARGALFRKSPSEVLIRTNMVFAGAIRAVINLPSGSAYNHGLPMSLIIFSGESDTKEKQREILFINMPKSVTRVKALETSSIYESIHNACELFYKFESGQEVEQELGYSSVVNYQESNLIKTKMNLDPAVHVSQVTTGVDTILNVSAEAEKIYLTSLELSSLTREAKDQLNKLTIKAEFTTIGDLISSGQVSQFLGMLKNNLPENFEDYKNEDDNRTFFKPEDLRETGELRASGSISKELMGKISDKFWTEPGDVVFIKTGTPAAKVDTKGGSLILSPLSVLRVRMLNTPALSPQMLAFILNGKGVKKYMDGGVIGRLQVESVPIPKFDAEIGVEINQKLLLIQALIMKSKVLNEHLHTLEQRLNNVLSGEIDGFKVNK